jgi:hypothetical protein
MAPADSELKMSSLSSYTVSMTIWVSGTCCESKDTLIRVF